MLIIDKNFDLKKLEKMGFKKNYPDIYYYEKEYETRSTITDKYTFSIVVNPAPERGTNHVIGCFNACDDELDEPFELDVIYDLIQMGAIKKVDTISNEDRGKA